MKAGAATPSSPLIAVTTAQSEIIDGTLHLPAQWSPTAVVGALVRAGATPILAPIGVSPAGAAQVISSADGLLLTGGNDVALFGAPHRAHFQDPQRDHSDLLYLRQARQRGIPVLGICRGMQLLVASAGGTLCAVPGHLSQGRACPSRHSISVVAGSRLATALGVQTTDVNSLHRYAVATCGQHVAVAHAVDDVIEAVEHPDRWELGVQWHPELEGLPQSHRLWRSFVEAAAQRQDTRAQVRPKLRTRPGTMRA